MCDREAIGDKDMGEAYVVHVHGSGYFSGQNKKYYDMFNVSAKMYAKTMPKERAEKLADRLRRIGYTTSVEHANMSGGEE